MFLVCGLRYNVWSDVRTPLFDTKELKYELSKSFLVASKVCSALSPALHVLESVFANSVSNVGSTCVSLFLKEMHLATPNV